MKYDNPVGYSGIGSDIKWCGKWTGSKFCLYCGHRAKFEEWSKNWHWYYLLSWSNMYYWPWENYAHFKVPQLYGQRAFKWRLAKNNRPHRRYKTTGVQERDIKSLLRKGCKKTRKCKCMSVVQRGAWYCPGCYYLMNRMAKHNGVHFHDITVTDRNEIKRDVLTLLLSGTI